MYYPGGLNSVVLSCSAASRYDSLKEITSRDMCEFSPGQLLISVSRETELCKSVFQVKEMLTSSKEGLC